MFLIGSFFLALSPVLPDIADDLDASSAQLGYPGAAYGLALGLTSVGFAPFHDILARRRVLASGMALHCAGLLLVALSPTWFVLILGHAFCGVGGGIYAPAAYAAISERTPESRRASILGRVNVGWAMSTLLGVPFAAFASSGLGWRTVMIAFAAIWLFVAMLTAQILTDRGRRTIVSAAADRFWSRAVWQEMKGARLPWLYLSTILVFVGFYGIYAFLGTAVRNDLNVTASGAGILVSVYGLGFLTGTLNAWIIDKTGPQRSLFVATMVLSGILFTIPLATSFIAPLVIAMFLWGIFQNAAFTSFTTIVGSANPSIRGRAFSINTACVFFGSSIGTASMGVVSSGAGFPAAGAICMTATLAASATVGLKILEQA